MRAERMTRVRAKHDSRIAKEAAAPVLDGPTRDAALREHRAIAVELAVAGGAADGAAEIGHHHRRSEEHTSELQSQANLVCRLLLEKKNIMLRAPRCAAAASDTL